MSNHTDIAEPTQKFLRGNINFVFLSIDPNVNVPQPANWDKLLGHDKRWKEGGPGTIGYSEAGDFHDVLLVPPLANITVRRNFVPKHAPEANK